eukprot:IDg17350t1
MQSVKREKWEWRCGPQGSDVLTAIASQLCEHVKHGCMKNKYVRPRLRAVWTRRTFIVSAHAHSSAPASCARMLHRACNCAALQCGAAPVPIGAAAQAHARLSGDALAACRRKVRKEGRCECGPRVKRSATVRMRVDTDVCASLRKLTLPGRMSWHGAAIRWAHCAELGVVSLYQTHAATDAPVIIVIIIIIIIIIIVM